MFDIYDNNIFKRDFNQEILYSLSNYKKLEILIFVYYFNQKLSNSLNNLTNLKTLVFGELFK
jgi:hypothetical protein